MDNINLTTLSKAEEIKQEIRSLVNDYYQEVFRPKEFFPGKTHIPVSGKVFDDKDIYNIIESALDGWFTTGRFNEAFEKKLASYIGANSVRTVN